MKQVANTIIIFFLALFFYTKFAGPIPFSVNTTTTTTADAFTVTGEGKVNIAPDMAVVNVGVTAQGATAKAAQEQLNTKINAVSKAVKAVGVDAKDIQTSNYSMYQDQQTRRYQASSNLTIKVRDLDKANAVIDAATQAEANQIGGVSFDIADKTKAENEARQEAVADAKEKAQNASKIAGFTLGRIINYSENFGGYPRPLYMEAKAMGSAPDQVATQIEPGTNEIAVSVTLSFEIR